MPWFSYHSGHSGQYCRHAKGRLADVVEAAVERGFTHYGLSEHCPRDRQRDLYPGEEDLGPDGLASAFDQYMQEARQLQLQYEGRIQLLVGFETERLPPGNWAQRMLGLRKRYRADYIIGSVHDVDGIWIDMSAEMTTQAADACGGLEALQRKYFTALAELVTTLRPEVVGHLDLVRKFAGDEAHFSPAILREAERTLEAVRAVGALLDVNPGAYRRGLSPVYPLPSLLRRAQEMGVGVTLGDDGHGPHDVGVGLDACIRAISDAGYREVHYLERCDGTVQKASAALAEVVAKPPGR